MNKTRKILSVVLALCMMFSAMTCLGMVSFAADEEAIVYEKSPLALDSEDIKTGLTVKIMNSTFYREDMSQEGDAEEGYVTTFRQDLEGAMDIDLYVWANESENLRQIAQGETVNEVKYMVVNGVPVAVYSDVETEAGDETEYETLTAIFEADNNYAELVFWIGEKGEISNAVFMAQAMAIIASVSTTCKAKNVISTLNVGDLKLDLTGKMYIEGYDANLDAESGQIGYYYSLSNDVDFDVYVWDVDEETPDLEAAVAAELENYDGVEAVKTKLGEFDAYYYDAVDEDAGVEYATRTYLVQNGETIYEIVFYMEGENAEKIVTEIVGSLADSTACTNRVTGFCATYNKFKDVPVIGIVFSMIHATLHTIMNIFKK